MNSPISQPPHEDILAASFSWAKGVLGRDLTPSKEYGRDDNHILRLSWANGSAFLKVGRNLKAEADRLAWLKGKIATPLLLGFICYEDVDALLMSTVPGINTCTLKKHIGPDATVTKLADALRLLHAVDPSDCPFGTPEVGNVLTHGDACLPNFMFHEDGRLSGYIDLGDLAVAPKEVDLAATVWSLQFNFGKGYGLPFLKQYGVPDPTEKMVDELHDQYESRVNSSQSPTE